MQTNLYFFIFPSIFFLLDIDHRKLVLPRNEHHCLKLRYIETEMWLKTFL